MATRHRNHGLAAWALLAALSTSCTRKADKTAAGESLPANAVVVTLAYGSEKKTWLEEQVKAFAATSPTVDGRPVVIKTRPMGSGEAVQGILRGELQPHVFSPASAAYVTLLNDAWLEKTGRAQALAPGGEPLLLSPVVIALWKPMAQALGWPDKRLGWKDLLAVARDKAGWGGRGHGEWGQFKLGHTHPELSSSGLMAVLAAAYAGADKVRGLTPADLDSKPVRAFIGDVESSIVHYGKSTGFFAERMRARGPAYLSAAVLYENLVVESYASPPRGVPPIVSIYPREGTFWCDHPFAVLDAEWVGPPERKAAAALLAFLRARPAQERALALGFRPADPAIPVGAPIDPAHGADPKQPQTLLELPDAATLKALLAVWRTHKRHTDVTLVFDKSGSMSGPPLAEAKRGALAFLDRLSPDDQVSLLFFDNVVHDAFGPVALRVGKGELAARIDGVFASGGTALYKAVAAAHEGVKARAGKDRRRIHAVVVMTDGKDESSGSMSLEDTKRLVRAEGDQPVRVFAIAYGDGASGSVLQEIAEAGQGMSAQGNLENIVQVYDEMAAFF